MRYKGKIVDLCNSVRDIVFEPTRKIKFGDFKCDTIKVYKKMDKSLKGILNLLKRDLEPIF